MVKKVQVVVIGGGATGAGILRDLALRDVDCLLVEQNDLATGTSGRFHGLLHSGGRYVVKDLQSAEECIQENMILKRIAPFCIENTGGVFVATKNDDLSYVDKWLEGCKKAGIKTEEISPTELRKEESTLNRDVVKAYLVPDAAVDGFTLVTANILSAQKKGAKIKTYTEVVGFNIEDNKVRGVYIRDKYTGQEELVECDYVINAAGAWAGQIAALADQNLNVSPDKGVLVIFNHRIAKRVINHLRPPGNGDIFVPHGNVTIFGTTSRSTTSPDDNDIAVEEVIELLKEGSNLIPEINDLRVIRAFAGVRPLYQPGGKAQGRQVTRDFTLIDHAETGNLQGLVSVVGGKLTTYRLMAKATVDFVAQKIGVSNISTTEEEIMEAPIKRNTTLGKENYLCQCEMVSKDMLDQAVAGKSNFTLGDVRRLTRFGMGPCQGTFCNIRATGYYQESLGLDACKANKLLADHIQERWKGNRPILWGEQAQELELTRGIYLGLLNLKRLDCDSYGL